MMVIPCLGFDWMLGPWTQMVESKSAAKFPHGAPAPFMIFVPKDSLPSLPKSDASCTFVTAALSISLNEK